VKKPASSEYKKILLVELWGIGDLVLMSSIVNDLRRKFPTARMSLLSKPEGRELFEESGIFDAFIEFHFPWTTFTRKYRLWNWDWRGLVRTARRLREERFDLALTVRGDFREHILFFLTGIRRRVGYGVKGGGFFLTDHLHCDYRNTHRIDAWTAIANHVGTQVRDPHPSLSVSRDAEERVAKFLRDSAIGDKDLVVGIHPGAGVKVRRWPLERFATLAEYIRDEYHAKIVVLIEPGGYGEQLPMRGEFARAKVPLKELVALTKRLDMLICNEAGPMHVAVALNIPVVAIFGAGTPVWFGPRGKGHEVVMRERVACRPCADYCRFKDPFCITSVSVNDVQRRVDKTLKELALSKKG
jgi:heptosyltransferase-2